MTFLLTNKCIKFQISEKKRNVNGHTIIDVSKRKVSTNENKKRKIFSEKADGAHTRFRRVGRNVKQDEELALLIFLRP